MIKITKNQFNQTLDLIKGLLIEPEDGVENSQQLDEIGDVLYHLDDDLYWDVYISLLAKYHIGIRIDEDRREVNEDLDNALILKVADQDEIEDFRDYMYDAFDDGEHIYGFSKIVKDKSVFYPIDKKTILAVEKDLETFLNNHFTVKEKTTKKKEIKR